MSRSRALAARDRMKKRLVLLVLLACCAPLAGCFKTSDVLSGGDSALNRDGGPPGSTGTAGPTEPDGG
ncbi:MAG TPA: hypothetical protein VK509_20315, partial [Polyangiales bacterium]|nr:hypothetical protein [Polyangiales bacterium]